MTARILGIGLAIVFHVGILLFGGLLFPKPEDKKTEKKIEVVDLVSDSDKPKPDEKEMEKAEAQDEAEAPEMEVANDMPDLRAPEILDAASAAPALEALSLSALSDALNPGGGSDASGFYTGGAGLASGGRIGGTGLAGEAGDMDSIFSIADLDQKPRAVFQTPPNYPVDLRRRKIEGSVQVLFVVDEDGKVVDPKIEKTSNPGFDAPALEAVRRWKFEPGTRNGQKVRFRMRIPVRFSAG
jgi:protein TonB